MAAINYEIETMQATNNAYCNHRRLKCSVSKIITHPTNYLWSAHFYLTILFRITSSISPQKKQVISYL